MILQKEVISIGSQGKSVSRRSAVAGAIILFSIALLIGVQHWISVRGAESFERELARRGLDLDWRHFVPSVPPPDENFYGAPVVRAWLPPKGTSALVGKNEELPAAPALPPGWFQSAPVRLEELEALPRSGEERSLSALAEHFDRLEPGLRMLREAAMRPYVHLPGDYSSPERLPVPNYVAIRRIAQVLTSEARVHLLLGQGERVLVDLDTIEAVTRALDSKPVLLISAMIRVAVVGLYIEVVRDGFSLGVWKGIDLAGLRARLEKVDLVPIVLESLAQGEMTATCYLLKRLAEDGPVERLRLLKSAGYDNGFRTQLLSFVPGSSMRRNVLLAAELFQEAPQIFAPDGSRFYPKRMASAVERMGLEFGRMRLDNIFAASLVPNLMKASTVCAKNQTLLRLGIIACALEEYRALHGGYPQRLEDLESAGGASLPRDLITGTLPIYRLSESGYELYSPGQDEKDDGGSLTDWVFTPGR